MPHLSEGATRRVTRELQKLNDNLGEGADRLEGGPVAEDKLHEWAVYLKGFTDTNASPSSQAFGKQLVESGLDGVEFRVVFPPNYPNDPPFVYARKPRIRGAHVFGGGAMCMDVLMPHGWTPATTVHALMRTIRSCFEDSIGLAADWQTTGGQVRENTEDAARRAFRTVESSHSDWKSATPARPAPPVPIESDRVEAAAKRQKA